LSKSEHSDRFIVLVKHYRGRNIAHWSRLEWRTKPEYGAAQFAILANALPHIPEATARMAANCQKPTQPT
jgi:hypothetical protein